jgi:HD superfamily phosphohydrolase
MRDGVKIFKDPIYDLIYFDKQKDKPILEIINTPEFQRLRRIRQLGLSSYTYTSATHDRFSHSIGVCFLAGLIVDSLKPGEIYINEGSETITLNGDDAKLLIRLAAILHDIGHGPFSHAFERAIKKKVETTIKSGIQIHEDYSIKIITSEPIRQIIENIPNEDFKKYGIKWITDILAGTFTGSVWVKDIISSQFDADRIDYLLRDAYMCGVKYAGFDWQWLFRNMSIGDVPTEQYNVTRKGILIEENKGVHSLEAFVISRYHMYEQVYFHKTTRGFEAIVNAIFKRLNFLIDQKGITEKDFLGQYFLNFLTDYNSIFNYLHLDDYYMISHFHHWSNACKDEILRELCTCFINRRTFKMIKTISVKTDGLKDFEEYIKLRDHYKEKLKEKFDYYFLEDDYKNNPYKDTYLLSKSPSFSERIWVSKAGEPKDLSEESEIIKSLRNNVLEVKRIYVHRDFL